MQATKNVPNFLYFFGEQLQTMFIWMIVLLSIVCADNGLGGGLSGKVGWCVTTGDLLKVKMFEEGQIRMIFCFLRPIFLIFGLKSIYRGSLAIEPHSSARAYSCSLALLVVTLLFGFVVECQQT
jgi:hypothetical protein